MIKSINSRVCYIPTDLGGGYAPPTIDIITREGKGSELEHNEVDSNFLNLKSFALDLYSNKQDLLVSGTNIKTVNGTTILGSGDIDLTVDLSGKQDLLVSGINIKTVNGTSILGRGNIDINPASKNFKKFISIDPNDGLTEVTVNLLDISSEEINTEIIGFLKFTAIVLVTDNYGNKTLKPFTFDFVLEYLWDSYSGYNFRNVSLGASWVNVYIYPEGNIQFRTSNGNICAGVVVDFTAAENLKPTTIVSENVYLTPVV